MDQDDGGDGVVGVDEAEGGAGSVEGLGDDDAADYCGMDFGRKIVYEEMGAGGVGPAPVKYEAEEEDVAPVDQERGAIVDEFGEQGCGERRERDGAKEGDVDPGQIAVGAGEIVELGLLADPEDAVGHDAHHENDEAWRENNESMAEVVLGVDSFGGGDAKVEHEQGHGNGEDSVAESGDAFDALACNAVVEGWHLTGV